jgi:serine/threonine-protein kinase
MAGQRFGRYEIERLLGRGAMGAVYLARESDLDRLVALKVISMREVSDSIVERFHREARAAARINSDNVVKVYEVGSYADTPFIAMEYVEGRSLDRILAEQRRLEVGPATRIALDVARGLQSAHEAGILHRDLKPGNILISNEGRAKVSDFGLAKALRELRGWNARLTDAGTTVGSPAYMAPEQAKGMPGLDARTDIYSLGVTYYELLTGRLPFEGESAIELLDRKLAGRFLSPRRLRPDLPAAADEACGALLASSPDARPESMSAAIRLLERALVDPLSLRSPAP